MAGFSDRTESDILQLWLANKAIAQVASTATSSAFTNTWVALHTADPGDTGTQGTNESTYAAYTRIAVARTTTGWATSTSAGNASPVAAINFPQNTATSTATFNYASIGWSSATTDGTIIASGSLNPAINLSQNVTPQLTTGSSFTLD